MKNFFDSIWKDKVHMLFMKMHLQKEIKLSSYNSFLHISYSFILNIFFYMNNFLNHSVIRFVRYISTDLLMIFVIFFQQRIIVKNIYIYSCGTCTRIVLMFTVNHVKRDLFIGSLEPPGAQFLSNDDR